MSAAPTTLTSLGEQPSIRLDRPIVLVGRSPECDVVIDSAKVSRKHCCIAQVNGYLVARDLGSTNGIQINGRKLDESKLVLGDEIAIGNVVYRVEREGVETVAPPPKESAPYSDSVLERFDEPVPLPETDHGGSEILNAFEQKRTEKPQRNKLLETDPEENYQLQIPDDIRLLPISDSEVKVDKSNSSHAKDEAT